MFIRSFVIQKVPSYFQLQRLENKKGDLDVILCQQFLLNTWQNWFPQTKNIVILWFIGNKSKATQTAKEINLSSDLSKKQKDDLN